MELKSHVSIYLVLSAVLAQQFGISLQTEYLRDSSQSLDDLSLRYLKTFLFARC